MVPGDTDRAQELTQAAFVKTYVVWHKIDQDRALAYARRCLVNHKIDVWRATRHEVAAGAPSSLTFRPESVLRQGSRTIRRRRIIASGSAAMAVALVAVGATVLTRPHDTALPLPADRTATTGIARSQMGNVSGTFEVEFDRDARVMPNVHYFFRNRDGQRHEVGTSSTGKPGPEA